MLAIRLARTGRHGHAQFRLIVQDSHRHPKRGKVVAYLGSYNPHTKVAQIDKEAAQKYLDNGAQPSDSAARILKNEGVTLPKWYKTPTPKERAVRNPEKRRSTRPAKAEAPAEVAVEPVEDVAPAQEAAPSEEAPSTEESPAEEPTPDEAKEPQPKAPADEPVAEEESTSDEPPAEG